jgi:hypothetical protein
MGNHRKSKTRNHAFLRSASASFGALFERNDFLQDIAEWEWQMVSLNNNTNPLEQQTMQIDREFFMFPLNYPYQRFVREADALM